jgi:transketolase
MLEEDLRKRILDISKRKGLTHVGSCISCLPILIEIYEKKNVEDKVILCNAHAHLAHLVVREHEGLLDFKKIGTIEEHIDKFGIHCDREAGCDATGGSLGHGIGIGIGMALVDRSRDVYVIVSDGSMQEGSNFEALRIKTDLELNNLHIYCNFNGFSAVAPVDLADLTTRMIAFDPTIKTFLTENGEGFEGIEGHYKKL